jgi:hypothetical protein
MPPSPSGTMIGGSHVGSTHVPSALQNCAPAQVPQLCPQLGSGPHWRFSHRGVHSGHLPHSASGEPQRGGIRIVKAQDDGKHVVVPSE